MFPGIRLVNMPHDTLELDDIPASVLSQRQNRTLSVYEDSLRKQLEQDRFEPKSLLQRLVFLYSVISAIIVYGVASLVLS